MNAKYEASLAEEYNIRNLPNFWSEVSESKADKKRKEGDSFIARRNNFQKLIRVLDISGLDGYLLKLERLAHALSQQQ